MNYSRIIKKDGEVGNIQSSLNLPEKLQAQKIERKYASIKHQIRHFWYTIEDAGINPHDAMNDLINEYWIVHPRRGYSVYELRAAI